MKNKTAIRGERNETIKDQAQTDDIHKWEQCTVRRGRKDDADDNTPSYDGNP